ncbi:Sec-independent protein translocase protein TatB [Photorhabdus laumondii]|uniref:Sec-independent protein translocase protein TatB n=1 Tax=Photorhabdus laumondii TaxID=2218628 RepID=UPI0033153778
MFDIGFGELLLVMVIGLVVLGPERLPVAVKTVAGWIRALRSLAANVQNELVQELKLQELQESLKKVQEEAGLQNLSPELKASMDELKEAAESLKKAYQNEPDAGSMKASEINEVAQKPAASQVVASSGPSALVDDQATSATKKKTSD